MDTHGYALCGPPLTDPVDPAWAQDLAYRGPDRYGPYYRDALGANHPYNTLWLAMTATMILHGPLSERFYRDRDALVAVQREHQALGVEPALDLLAVAEPGPDGPQGWQFLGFDLYGPTISPTAKRFRWFGGPIRERFAPLQNAHLLFDDQRVAEHCLRTIDDFNRLETGEIGICDRLLLLAVWLAPQQ